MVGGGSIVDNEQKGSIKKHLLANKNVADEFWSNVESLAGLKSSGMLTEANYRRELDLMVEGLVKGAKRPSKREGAVSTTSLPPARPAKVVKLQGRKAAAKAAAAVNTRGGNITNC